MVLARLDTAFVPFDKSVNLSNGRCYLMFHDGDQKTLKIAMTEGNDGSPLFPARRLIWLPAADFTNTWLFGRGATSLLFDPAYDDNLRAAVVFSNPNGIVNLDLKDQNDYALITSHLACSLTHSCN